MVTALDDEGSRARLAASGINDVLTKPINRWELRALLERMLCDNAEKIHD
jgi:DNA-binding response OmpR family regulator